MTRTWAPNLHVYIQPIRFVSATELCRRGQRRGESVRFGFQPEGRVELVLDAARGTCSERVVTPWHENQLRRLLGYERGSVGFAHLETFVDSVTCPAKRCAGSTIGRSSTPSDASRKKDVPCCRCRPVDRSGMLVTMGLHKPGESSKAPLRRVCDSHLTPRCAASRVGLAIPHSSSVAVFRATT